MAGDGSLNRFPWPPVLTVGLAVAAVALARVVPGGLALPQWATLAGWLVTAAGAALMAWAILTMRRAATNVLPNRPADRLVTHGPFALSRNPIYVADVTLLAGLGLALSIPWFWAAAAIDAMLLHRLAVRPEEAHMAARFGAAWTAYSARVPRWLGPI